jgi:signal transduction histidine kinase
VRFRVTALATVAVIAVLAVSGVILVALQRETLTSNLDESLARYADAVVTDLTGRTVPSYLTTHGDADVIAQLVAGDGAVRVSSANLAGKLRVSRLVPPARGDALRGARNLIPGRGSYRLLARQVRFRDVGPATLYLAAPLDDVTGNIRTLTRSMLAAVPLMAALLAALVWWLVGRTLRPVERIRAEVASMRGTDIHKRVPEPGGGDEIDRLAQTMNAMLERIDEATLRQRRFVADASHELRTPLTRMRSEIEVDLAHPGAADHPATHRSILEELIALQRVTENLLLLARADAPALPSRSEIVDLDDIVLEEARGFRSLVASVDTSKVSAARVRGDTDQLRRIVRNLIDNATRHAPTTVTIELNESPTGATLVVADDGPGIPDEDRERIFERFTRLDGARSAATGGAGLGLAIAREMVEAHGGTISVMDGPRTGACFVVSFPLVGLEV